MDFKGIGEKLRTGITGIIGEEEDYGRFSVLIPIVKRNDEHCILFEVRAKTLRNQPGEISLPGGRIEKGEEPIDAAIRETSEELNIKKESISIIGRTDILVTQHLKILYPFVGEIDEEFISPYKGEVDHVFYVPIEFFINNMPKSMKIRIESKPEGEFPYYDEKRAEEYKWSIGRNNVYFYKYNNYIIWGLTARIIKNFIKEIKNDI